MGKIDVPTTIDYIKAKTGVNKLTYVGHSQGTSQIFSALSDKIDYFRNNLNGAIALGAVSNLKYSSSFILQFAIKIHLADLVKTIGVYEMLRGPSFMDTDPFIGYFCKLVPKMCQNIVALVADAEPSDDDQKAFVEYSAHFPAGTSVKSLIHFSQINLNGAFTKFDYGKTENMKRYGQPFPPVYPVENIKQLPICILYGEHDHLSTERDNEWLSSKLKTNGALHFEKKYTNMGHITYFVPKENRSLNDTLKCISDFNK